jgi:hypothetical protein
MPNFEDELRVANEVFAGLRHWLMLPGAEEGWRSQIQELEKEIQDKLTSIARTVLQGEEGIASPTANREKAFNYLVSFLMSFASRAGTRDRLHIFTTNYDRVIEAGAEIAGLHF